jgi:hypothetical protein
MVAPVKEIIDTSLYIVFIAKEEGTRPVGWLVHRWENNIKMDFEEIDWEGLIDWLIDLAQDRNL